MPAISWFDFLEFSQLQWKNDLKKMNLEECRRERSWYRAYLKISYDGVRLISQNCGLYGPIVRPRVIVMWTMV
jgi:hypothetical protein